MMIIKNKKMAMNPAIVLLEAEKEMYAKSLKILKDLKNSKYKDPKVNECIKQMEEETEIAKLKCLMVKGFINQDLENFEKYYQTVVDYLHNNIDELMFCDKKIFLDFNEGNVGNVNSNSVKKHCDMFKNQMEYYEKMYNGLKVVSNAR